MLSGQQLAEWEAFLQIEPLEGDKTEFMLAQLCSIVANVNRDSKKRPQPFEVKDFMLQLDPKPKKRMSQDELKEAVLGLASAFGAKPSKKKRK